MTEHFLEVTELPGVDMSQEQFERMCHRYYWAAKYVADRDVLEVACGAGPGLDYLAKRARTVKAGDYSPEVLARAQRHVGKNVELKVFDAQDMPFPDSSFDAVIMFEALYYIGSAERFVSEVKRVLRPDGILLISSANKDLYDFNPSPHSTTYHGVADLYRLLTKSGFRTSFFGYLRIDQVSLRQRILRPFKKLAVNLDLIPKTMTGKKLLKRLVFGSMLPMPDSIVENMIPYQPPEPIDSIDEDRSHKIFYCAASLS